MIEYESVNIELLKWIFGAVAAAVALVFLILWRKEKQQGRLNAIEAENAWQLQKQAHEILEQKYQELKSQHEVLLAELSVQKAKRTELEVALSVAKTQSEEQQKHHSEQLALLKEAKQALGNEFELVANRLFELKQKQFKESATDNLNSVISPFKHQLSDFYKRIEETQKSDAAHRNQLLGQISELQKQSQMISQEAVNLTNALKGSNKIQGNWGELILEKLLEQVGFVAGREYDIQLSGRDESGKLYRPDVVVHLPGEREIIIDSKVSLLAYEKYVNEEKDVAALKAHYDSVLAHIKNLSDKRYESLENVTSLDFVCLFIPIEPAYSILVQQYPDLLKLAYEKKVLLVSPASLMVVLRTVESLWQRDVQDKNIEKLVASAGRLYDQFVLFVESLTGVGQQIQKANELYEVSMKRLSEGRGNLIKRVEDLRALGAKTTKRLPDALLDKQADLAETQEQPETEAL